MVTYASDEPLAKIARFLGVFRLNEKTTRSSESYLEKGAIVQAEGAGDTGHSALWKAFGTDKGDFSFIFGLKTIQKTITENPLYLLMEACRRIDESNGVDIDSLITPQG